MNDRVTKNYFKDGGDTLVIGGKLVVEEDAEVEGLDTGGGSLSVDSDGTLSVAPASATVAGGMKKMPYMADFTDANFLSFETHFNQLLASLRTAGIMEDSE